MRSSVSTRSNKGVQRAKWPEKGPKSAPTTMWLPSLVGLLPPELKHFFLASNTALPVTDHFSAHC